MTRRTADEDHSATTDAENGGPLSDLRVLDLTQVLAGPFATMLLADLGADIVKVESPHGDHARTNQPFIEDTDPFGGYFQSINRNKRSISIDLKSEEGKEAFKTLVEDADVVVENFRSGTMDRLGLGYDTLRERNPELVYASISGFGDESLGESPYASRPAFDFIAQAMGGVMSITGTPEEGPTKVGPGIGDIFPGMLALVGLFAALRHRDRTGQGQYVDLSMVDGLVYLCERIVHQYSYTGEVPEPGGNSHPIFFPYDRYETKTGYVVIAAPEPNQWESLCEHLGRPDLAKKYETKVERSEHAEKLRPIVQNWVSSFERDELFELLGDDVPCAPVYDAADIFDDEHFSARDMLADVEQPGSGETVQIANLPIKLSNTPGGIRHRAPLHGEHSREVLDEAGFDDGEIDGLFADGVVSEQQEED